MSRCYDVCRWLTSTMCAGTQVAARKEASDRLKNQVGDLMKEKGDLFDTMFEAEEKIRLGEEGWKERYYQVRSVSAQALPPRCLLM